MVRLWVRLTPRGGADRIDGIGPAGELLARVRAAPAEGKANEALLRLMAAELDVPRSSVVIERGASARLKRVGLATATVAQVAARWPGVALG